jgi:RNA polymerase sigma factor (sigma-70 family)
MQSTLTAAQTRETLHRLAAASSPQSIAGFSAGQEAAFQARKGAVEKAFIANERLLIAWLYKFVGDYETAQDIAQAAFLNVWIYADRQGIEQPKSLLFKTARNLTMNELRRRKRLSRRTFAVRDAADLQTLQEQADENPSPEECLSRRQETEVILNALNGQPRKLRMAFRLHRFDGLTYRQIAEKIGVSESSVGKYIMEVLRSLREAERGISEAGAAPRREC